MTTELDLEIIQGSTFKKIMRWEVQPLVYKPITAIAKEAPVKITAIAHGLTEGWRVAVANVVGMTEINAKNTPPKTKDFHPVTLVDVDKITLNDVAADGYTTYQSGGHLVYYTPQNLGGYTSRMTIKDKVGGVSLIDLTTANSKILLDVGLNTITLILSATETSALVFKKAVYDLELVSGAGVVTALLRGGVTLIKEVTT